MKKLLCVLAVCSILTSCGPKIYYQMYQTTPMTENITVNEDLLVYEDDNCVVSYNFWKEKGDFGFKIYNKNSENIYLHVDECFCVKNGMAYDYYDFGVESTTICVPAKTAKVVSEFVIESNIYHDCDLYLNPGRKDKKFLSFTEENSPLTFGNIIAYTVGNSETLVRFRNDFYVSKVSNLKSKEVTKTVNVTECGKRLPIKEKIITGEGPNRFYNIYFLKSSVKKH